MLTGGTIVEPVLLHRTPIGSLGTRRRNDMTIVEQNPKINCGRCSRAAYIHALHRNYFKSPKSISMNAACANAGVREENNLQRNETALKREQKRK